MSKINTYIKTIGFLLIVAYIAPSAIFMIKQQWAHQFELHNKIGYLTITGSIETSSKYRKILNDYFKDNSIKAILIKIESDGGATGSCQALAYDIENFKRDYPKPIITYTENICTCGAYQIAAATDHIVATGSAIIGSIGKRNNHLQKLSYQDSNNIQESTSAQLGNQNKMQAEQYIMLQNLFDNSYLQITKEIASKRHLQMNKIDQWGCGKLFTGQQAYDLKLVDALGSKTTAINLIKKHIIPSDRKIEWIGPQIHHPLSMIFPLAYHEDCDDLDTQEKLIDNQLWHTLSRTVTQS